MKKKRTTVFDCYIYELPKMYFREGNITPLEGNVHVPFDIARVFYIYDIPGGESRGAHAHKKCHQFFVSASGSFDISIDDGINKKIVTLNRPYHGLYVPPMIWSHEFNFSSGSVCLVLASMPYDANDYIRNYDEFRITALDK